MKNSYLKLAIRLSAVLLVAILISKVNPEDSTAIAGEYAAILSSDSKVGTLPKGFGAKSSADVTGGIDAVGSSMTQTALADVTDEDRTGEALISQSLEDVNVSDESCDSNGEVYIPEDDYEVRPVTEVSQNDSKDVVQSVIAETEILAAETEVSDSETDDTSEQIEEDSYAENMEILPDDSEYDDYQLAENTDSDQNTAATDDNENGQAPSEISETVQTRDDSSYAGLSELEAAEKKAKKDSSYKETQEYINALLVTSPEHYNADIVNEALSIPTESNDARYEYITGKGYKAYTTSDMPKGFRSDSEASKRMVTFDVPVWKMTSSGKKYSTTWSITINKNLEASVRCIFSDIYLLDMKFPFNYLKGYKYRKVGGSGLVNSKLMSAHAFGVAIDINYYDNDNDYYLGKGNDLRNKDNPYCIPDEAIAIFEKYGWYWGGNFEICSDTMHFQYFGLEFLQYDSDEPFPILYRGAENMDPTYIRNLSKRLVKLGYLSKEYDSFGKKLDEALKAFQVDYGLEPDGIADYETWEPLINATHDVKYVF